VRSGCGSEVLLTITKKKMGMPRYLKNGNVSEGNGVRSKHLNGS
jgi:hypothetical protein